MVSSLRLLTRPKKLNLAHFFAQKLVFERCRDINRIGPRHHWDTSDKLAGGTLKACLSRMWMVRRYKFSGRKRG